MQKTSIAHWAEEDRPREKLLAKGRTVLTDSEIIAILIGSGNREQSAVELSREILAYYQNDLNKLAKASVNELMKFKGIGEAKAISIVSALELGRRRKAIPDRAKPKMDSPANIYEYFKPYLSDLQHEEFWILLLDQAYQPLRHLRIGQGGVAAVIADAKLVFKPAVELLAPFIVLVHNHPSGSLNPSQQDLNITKKLVNAGKLFDIKVLDHLIFTDQNFFSFSNNDLLNN